jgi:hypothetical protein
MAEEIKPEIVADYTLVIVAVVIVIISILFICGATIYCSLRHKKINKPAVGEVNPEINPDIKAEENL